MGRLIPIVMLICKQSLDMLAVSIWLGIKHGKGDGANG